MPAAPGSLTFVSVVFEAEYDLLRLQARSMSRHVPAALAAKVVVIDNSRSGMPASELDALRRDLGQHGSALEVLTPSTIAQLPPASGWHGQQVLKLCVARRIETERYVVLDAKNHFIDTPSLRFFESQDGRPRASWYSFEDHHFRPTLEKVLRYVDLPVEPFPERFTSTITPFVLDTSDVLEMVDEIGASSDAGFEREFIDRGLAEFFLYGAWSWARYGSLEQAFELHEEPCPVVWPKAADADGVRAAVRLAALRRSPIFAVHRRAVIAMDADARAVLSDFWVDRSLFAERSEAEAFLDRAARRIRIEDRRARRRQLPARLAARLRRIRTG
jgi:hypothetical protein